MRHLISDIDCRANAASGGESLNYQGTIRNGCYLAVVLVISENIVLEIALGAKEWTGENQLFNFN